MLGVTMRVMRHSYAGGAVEERDALARDWARFLARVLPGEPVCCLPNTGADILDVVRGWGLDGLIFSGGEDWGVFPARDATEAALFGWARGEGLPVFGVCRGAQVINRLLGGNLHACVGHVAVRHGLRLTRPVAGGLRHEVNSFHARGMVADDLARALSPLAFAPDGTVEAFTDPDGLLCGVMWHPERERTPAELDVLLLRECFGKKEPEAGTGREKPE